MSMILAKCWAAVKARLTGGLAPRAVAVLAAAVLSAAGGAWAAPNGLPPGRILFRTYGPEQGLGNLAVEAMTQDSTGFLWVATQDGLYRFDGKRFIRFGIGDGLPNPLITSLLADGELWVGTFSGLAWARGGHFVVVPASAMPRTRVNGLAMDAAGNLWVARPQGLSVRDPAGIFRPAPGWPAEEATAVTANAASKTVYAAFGTRIGRADGAGAWRFWDSGFDAGERIDALTVDGTGRLWAASVHQLSSMGPADEGFRDECTRVPEVCSAPDQTILTLDRSGHLWVAADSALYHREGER